MLSARLLRAYKHHFEFTSNTVKSNFRKKESCLSESVLFVVHWETLVVYQNFHVDRAIGLTELG